MNNTEKISIVVPVYNTAPYLECFFSHMELQTFKDYKAYIVYDESTDGSLKIIQSCVKRDPKHFEVLFSPNKDGLGAARDYALNSGKVIGDYILFLDPDDYPEYNFLERLYETAISSGADITICGFERFDDKTGKIICTEMVHNPDGIISNVAQFDLLAYMNPVVWDKLYKKSVIQDLRFTNIKRTEDVFWLMRVLPRIKSIICVNEVLYHYRVREDSLLNTLSDYAYEEVKQGFISISKEMSINGIRKSEYWDLIEFIAFCRFGIGVTYRVSNTKNCRRISKYTKQMFDKYYSTWRKNKFLKLSNCKNHGLKGIAIWLCGILYKCDLMIIYVATYSFVKNRLKKEVRW